MISIIKVRSRNSGELIGKYKVTYEKKWGTLISSSLLEESFRIKKVEAVWEAFKNISLSDYYYRRGFLRAISPGKILSAPPEYLYYHHTYFSIPDIVGKFDFKGVHVECLYVKGKMTYRDLAGFKCNVLSSDRDSMKVINYVNKRFLQDIKAGCFCDWHDIKYDYISVRTLVSWLFRRFPENLAEYLNKESRKHRKYNILNIKRV